MSNQELVRASVLEWVRLFHSTRKQYSLLRPALQTKGAQTEIGASGRLLNSVRPLCSLPLNKQYELHLSLGVA